MYSSMYSVTSRVCSQGPAGFGCTRHDSRTQHGTQFESMASACVGTRRNGAKNSLQKKQGGCARQRSHAIGQGRWGPRLSGPGRSGARSSPRGRVHAGVPTPVRSAILFAATMDRTLHAFRGALRMLVRRWGSRSYRLRTFHTVSYTHLTLPTKA